MEQLPSEKQPQAEAHTGRVTRVTTARPKRRAPAFLALISALALLTLALGQETPIPIEEGQEPFAMEVLVEGLESPWEVTYGPDDWLWVTERQGARITRVNPADGTTAVAVEIDDDVHIGPQHEGVLGMALHPELLQGTGNDFVYVAYTYNVGSAHEIDRRMKIRRYTWDEEAQQLIEPVDILTDLDAWDDHNAGRLAWGPDDKLYFSTGEQGGNQFGNFLRPINAQMLPTAPQVSPAAYEGKILRINPDGSIPEDNPELNGVVTHVYSYGHRNPQGLTFGPDGTLYSVEHGPRVDDELNIIQAGGNYGWPNVAGYQDDQGYEYANWSEIPEVPEGLVHDDENVPESVPVYQESEFEEEIVEPIQTFWTVGNDYDFTAGCGFVCWPTIAPSSVDYYEAGDGGIGAWDNSLLITTLKHGAIYRVALTEDGQAVEGEPLMYFNTQNRYRDLAISPDGRTIYVATDNSGGAAALGGGMADELTNQGAILVFTYLGEDAPAGEADFPSGDTGPVTGPQGTQREGADGPAGEPAQGQEGQPEAPEEEAPADEEPNEAPAAPGDEEPAPPGDDNDGQDGSDDTGAADAAPATDDAELDVEALMAEGQTIYTERCAGCHGARGEGGAGVRHAGNEDLADTQLVLTFIHKGRGFMPAFAGTLDDEEIAAVATYIRNSWGNEFGPVSPEESAALR